MGIAVIALAGYSSPSLADAETDLLPTNLLGSPGIVDMPSARMAPDGQLTAGASFFKNTQHYNFGFQVTPWLETSFRYSGLTHFDPAYPVYYDRSFAFKLRMWEEGDVLPALAVGVDDAIGTGIYAGEFVVASKKFGDFDATIGMGWGRLSTADTIKNPLGAISNSFLRDRNNLDTAGGANFNILFHGPRSGIFGGLTWQSPIKGLVLAAEYSSDAYSREAASGNFTPKNQFNFGAQYQPVDNVTLGLDWLYGDSIGGTISFSLDPVHDPFPRRIGPTPPPTHIRTPEEQQQALNHLLRNSARQTATAGQNPSAMIDALWNSTIDAEDVAIKGRVLIIRVHGGKADTICRNAAQLVAGRGLAIDIVAVTGSGAAARCNVPHTSRLFETALTQDEGATALHHLVEATPALITIDAAAPSRPTRLAAAAAIRRDSNTQLIHIEAMQMTDREAVIYYTNYQYFHESEVLDRLVRILMADAPPDVERFRLIATSAGVAQQEFDILREPTEREIEQSGSYDLMRGGNEMKSPPMENPVLSAASGDIYPRFNWSVFPQFRQELFDPENPFAVQFLGAGTVGVELMRGLSLQAEGEVNVYDNFNVNRPSDSQLPHVRSDFLEYFTQGKNGIGYLEMDYRFRLAPNVFAIARAGYLESMFAGVGGEVLWRPEGARWALGGDLYEVKQRDFDRLFGLSDYHVLTGHVSLYYASPWYDLNFMVSAGQYLAEDRGLTFQVTRRFDTGVEIGAFFTKTNVSADQFGEGSFDKGIIIRIPIGWAVPINTQAQFNLDLRPVQRDGGQRLLGDAPLYGETARSSQAEMEMQSQIATEP